MKRTSTSKAKELAVPWDCRQSGQRCSVELSSTRWLPSRRPGVLPHHSSAWTLRIRGITRPELQPHCDFHYQNVTPNPRVPVQELHVLAQTIASSVFTKMGVSVTGSLTGRLNRRATRSSLVVQQQSSAQLDGPGNSTALPGLWARNSLTRRVQPRFSA